MSRTQFDLNSGFRRTALILAGVIAGIGVTPAQAQLCQRDGTPITFSAANFPDGTDDTVNMKTGDNPVQLIWKRCAVGQTWEATKKKCKGVPVKKTWKEALQLAALEPGGWRLPNVNELAAIIDYQCYAPPINLTVFPNTPESDTAGFWSSTPFQHVMSTGNTAEAVHAWYFRLSDGGLEHRPVNEPTEKNFVKLVKSAN